MLTRIEDACTLCIIIVLYSHMFVKGLWANSDQFISMYCTYVTMYLCTVQYSFPTYTTQHMQDTNLLTKKKGEGDGGGELAICSVREGEEVGT